MFVAVNFPPREETVMLVMLRLLKTLSRAIVRGKAAARRARADDARHSVSAAPARVARLK
jgi:hypothetical protein